MLDGWLRYVYHEKGKRQEQRSGG